MGLQKGAVRCCCHCDTIFCSFTLLKLVEPVYARHSTVIAGGTHTIFRQPSAVASVHSPVTASDANYRGMRRLLRLLKCCRGKSSRICSNLPSFVTPGTSKSALITTFGGKDRISWRDMTTSKVFCVINSTLHVHINTTSTLQWSCKASIWWTSGAMSSSIS